MSYLTLSDGLVSTLYGANEQLVYSTVLGKLGMKRRTEQISLSRADNRSIRKRCERLCRGADRKYFWRTNKYRVKRRIQANDVEIRLERLHLTAEGVSLNRDVHHWNPGFVG
jgi:hypothetical protein